MALSSPSECTAFLEQLLRHELSQGIPDVTRLSIALGVVEMNLTSKDVSKQQWPQDLSRTVDLLDAAFEQWVTGLATASALAAAPSPAAKVKAVADAVWSKLNKGYSKDLQHAQHVYNFVSLLLPSGVAGLKKQLDCAGVVTTTYATCHALSRCFPQHADLAAARMQVSEDHCWIQLGPDGRRQAAVEVTTDTPAKRGLPVAPEAWSGWLYTGGHAVLCTPHQALAALVTSLNPAISGSKKGSDSEKLQGVQRRLLEVLLEAEPGALYPAALCALADLEEVTAQDSLDAARDSGDAAQLARLLQRRPGDAQDLFERAIQVASGSSMAAPLKAAPAAAGIEAAVDISAAVVLQIDGAADGGGATALRLSQEQQPQQQQEQQQGAATNGAPTIAAAAANSSNADGDSCSASSKVGYQWYVFSYLAAFLSRRAEFLASCSGAPGDHHWQAAASTHAAALEAASRGAAVLAKYRFSPSTDDQLFKDIEGVLEEVVRDSMTALAIHSGGQLTDPAPCASLLLLWDGVCQLFTGKAKPSGWVALVMRAAKLFSPEAREGAAAAVEGRVGSGPMVAARPLWRDLKPVPLKPLFEAADVGGGGGSGPGERPAKRQRR